MLISNWCLGGKTPLFVLENLTAFYKNVKMEMDPGSGLIPALQDWKGALHLDNPWVIHAGTHQEEIPGNSSQIPGSFFIDKYFVFCYNLGSTLRKETTPLTSGSGWEKIKNGFFSTASGFLDAENNIWYNINRKFL